jgi:hypothetical protein
MDDFGTLLLVVFVAVVFMFGISAVLDAVVAYKPNQICQYLGYDRAVREIGLAYYCVKFFPHPEIIKLELPDD